MISGEDHSSITGFAIKEGVTQFFKLHIDKLEDPIYLGNSIYSVIVDLLSWLWTEEEVDDDDLRVLSSVLGFSEVEDFLKKIQVANLEEKEPQVVWEKRYRESFS